MAKDANLTLTLNRTDLNLVMMGVKSLEELISDGIAKFAGDISILKQPVGLLDEFDIGFEILPGTKMGKKVGSAKNLGLDSPA